MIAAVLAGLFAGASAPASAVSDAPRTTIYRNATVIDGTGRAAQKRMAITVEGERIVSVTPDRHAKVPPGAETVDATGLFALPGLIDTHVHLATLPVRSWAEGTLRRLLYSGVTATRDMAGDTRFLGELQRKVRLGEVVGPDVYYSALMAGPSFFKDGRTRAAAQGETPGQVAWMQAIDKKTDLKIAVARARGTGASAIKIYANLPGETIRQIVAEAHRQNFPVWSHSMVFPATPAEVVEAGPDVLSHVCFFGYQVSRKPKTYHEHGAVDAEALKQDRPEIAALFKQMRERGMILDATMRVFVQRAAAGEQSEHPLGNLRCTRDVAFRLTNQAFREGVMISAGSDGDTDWKQAYPSLHEELDLLAREAKIPAMDVIRAATAIAARTIGQQDMMGTVEAGKLANLVFVRQNPLDNVGNLRSVAFTVRRGTTYRREDYRPLTQEEMREPIVRR